MKTAKTALVILLCFTGLNAVVAGALFLLDPSGAKMGMSTSMIETSPFRDFLIPGLVLFCVNGLGSLAGMLLLIRDHRLAGYAGLVLGIFLCCWILVQLMWLPASFLQPVLFSIGAAETALACVIILKSRVQSK